MKGKPIILLITVGAKTGKLRKTPLMRVELNGEHAVVASLGGAPKNPVWYYNIAKNPRVELQDGTVTRDYDAREVFGGRKPPGGSAPSRRGPTTPSTRQRPTARFRCSC
jgi:F420H(2)-dependent quinone reductase